MLVIRDSALAAMYAANWQAHVEHSDLYEGRQEDTSPAEKPSRKRKAAWPYRADGQCPGWNGCLATPTAHEEPAPDSTRALLLDDLESG